MKKYKIINKSCTSEVELELNLLNENFTVKIESASFANNCIVIVSLTSRR